MKNIIGLFIIFVLLVSTAGADTVNLFNNQSIEGDIVNITNSILTLTNTTGLIIIPRSNISSIQLGNIGTKRLSTNKVDITIYLNTNKLQVQNATISRKQGYFIFKYSKDRELKIPEKSLNLIYSETDNIYIYTKPNIFKNYKTGFTAGYLFLNPLMGVSAGSSILVRRRLDILINVSYLRYFYQMKGWNIETTAGMRYFLKDKQFGGYFGGETGLGFGEFGVYTQRFGASIPVHGIFGYKWIFKKLQVDLSLVGGILFRIVWRPYPRIGFRMSFGYQSGKIYKTREAFIDERY